MHAKNLHQQRDAQTKNEPSMSGGVRSVFDYYGLDDPLSIEDGGDDFDVDAFLTEELSAREQLLLEVGIDPSLTDRERMEVLV